MRQRFYGLLMIFMPALACSYAPMTVINQSGQKLGLQNSAYALDAAKKHYPVVTICPEGGEEPGCPSVVTLQMSNAGGPFDWAYVDQPDNYYVTVKTAYNQTTLCPPMDPSCLYCLNNKVPSGQKNPADAAGVVLATVLKPTTLVLGAKQPHCGWQQAPDAPPATQAPYQVIDVGRNYTLPGAHPTDPRQPDKNHALMNLQPYFAAQGAATTDSAGNSLVSVAGPLSQFLTVGQGNSYPGRLYVKQNITAEDYQAIVTSKSCGPYIPTGQKTADPHKLVCAMTYQTADGKGIVHMPILLNNGLRALGITELMANTMGPKAPVDNIPYIMQISALPSDFGKGVATTSHCDMAGKSGQAIIGMVSYFSLGAYGDAAGRVGKVQYSLDATQVAAGQSVTAADAVRRITAVNAFPYNQSNDQLPESYNNGQFYFAINAKNPSLARLCYDASFEGLPSGIYQINIKATGMGASDAPDPGEVAYQTIYLNVHSNNPSWQSWLKHSAVPNTNLFNNDYGSGAHPVIGAYTYSSTDAANDPDAFQATYQQYANDIQHINKTYMSQQPLTTALAEVMAWQFAFQLNPQGYLNPLSYWPVCADTPEVNGQCQSISSTDPVQNIQSGWMGVNQPNVSGWLPSLTETLTQAGVGLTINFAFGNEFKASFAAFNPTQRSMVVKRMMTMVREANVDGVALDLEGGFNSPGAVDFYKLTTDSLAFDGKWFGLYYFASMFTPDVIASFGPLGQALISGYDMATYRATPGSDAPGPAPSPGVYSEWGSDAAKLTSAYENSISCSTAYESSPPYKTKSWCNTNVNAAVSESYRLWHSSFANTIWTCKGATRQNVLSLCTPSKAFATLNGNYQVVMPVSWSATLWSALELFNPDFTQFLPVKNTGQCSKGNNHPATCPPPQQGYILADVQKCAGLDNAWLKKNWDSSQGALNPSAAKQLSACIFQSTVVGKDVPVQSFSSCGSINGQVIPYDQCMVISALPGGQLPGSEQAIQPSTQAAYIKAVATVYQGSGGYYNGFSNNMVGMSMYALENFSAAPNGGAFLCGTAYNTSNPPKNPAMFAVQQPWYVGVNVPGKSMSAAAETCGADYVAYDPFYHRSDYQGLVDASWQAFDDQLQHSGGGN
jgi:hypothetical protein